MSELAAVVGYFFGVIMAFTAVVALALGLFNISATVNGPRHYPHAVIDRTVTAGATAQRRSLAAKKASPAKDVSPVVAGADIKKSKHHKPKVLARQPDSTAMGTRWVMPKNPDTAREVSSSADLAADGLGSTDN